MAGPAYSQVTAAAREFSCHAFPRDIGEAGLIKRYGRENVARAGVVGADDGPQDGTVLFPNHPELKIEIVWWDGEARTKVHWVRTREAASPWRSPDGIMVGMDLKTLEQRNGWPFRLAPFAREGSPGEVFSWGNGRFKIDNTGGCAVRIDLLPREGSITPTRNRLPAYQREFSSGHPVMQALNPRVYQMLIVHDWR
jgi:hypothetical protein